MLCYTIQDTCIQLYRIRIMPLIQTITLDSDTQARRMSHVHSQLMGTTC